MRRLFSRTAFSVGGLLVASLLAASCADNDSSLYLQGVLAPPQSQGGVCAYTADSNQAMRSSGVLDVGLLTTYSPTFLLGNQLRAAQSTEQAKSETNRIVVSGVVVRLTDAGGTEIANFTSLGSAFVDPASGDRPGFATMSVTIIDDATGRGLASSVGRSDIRKVIAYVKAFGRTLGGKDIESNELQYPIDVCNGCLPFFPADSVDQIKAAQENKPNCDAVEASTVATPCVVGQDQPVDCRLCHGKPVCDPSTVP